MVCNLLLSNLCHNFVASASRANSLFAAGSTRRWPQCTEQGEGGLVGLVVLLLVVVLRHNRKKESGKYYFLYLFELSFCCASACLMFIMNVTHERI